MKLTYNVEDKPGFGQVVVFAFQQLLAILAAVAFIDNVKTKQELKKEKQQEKQNAKIEKELLIVSGPIFSTNEVQKTIGKRCQVTVPEAFFKVVYDATAPVKALGFIVPNEGCTNALDWYTVTVDEVEKRTGMKFFDQIAPNEQPGKADFHPSLWNWHILAHPI